MGDFFKYQYACLIVFAIVEMNYLLIGTITDGIIGWSILMEFSNVFNNKNKAISNVNY